MFVKICGTTTVADAQLAVAHGANALGFIFAPSKRRVTTEQAAVITASTPANVLKVGVFTTADPAAILHTVRAAGLTAVQLHMPYSAELVQQIHDAFAGAVQLWQVVGVEVSSPANEQCSEPAREQRLLAALKPVLQDVRLSAVLLDAVQDGASGGLGKTFAWHRIRPVLANAAHHAEQTQGNMTPPKLILAGGLTPENVAEAIAVLAPWGVDVVSGVEGSPGRKSPERLQAFFGALFPKT